MSAPWTLSRGTDRLCGVVVAGPGAPGRGSAVPWPAGPPPCGSCAGARRPWFNAGSRFRLTPAPGRPVLHEGGVALARGCPYCTSPGPSWSTPDPPSVAPHPRAVHAERRQSHQARPLSGTTTGYSLPQTARPPLPQMPRAPKPSQSMRPRRRSALGDARRPPTFRVALYFSHITARKIRVGHRGERGKEILEIAWRRGRQGWVS